MSSSERHRERRESVEVVTSDLCLVHSQSEASRGGSRGEVKGVEVERTHNAGRAINVLDISLIYRRGEGGDTWKGGGGCMEGKGE